MAATSPLPAWVVTVVVLVISKGAPPRSCMDAGIGTSCGVEITGVEVVVVVVVAGLHATASAPTPNTIANFEDFSNSPTNMKQLLGNGRVANRSAVLSCSRIAFDAR